MDKIHQPSIVSQSKPFHEAYLSVCSLHKIWYAQYGNPNGVPVLILHGGPGAGCSDNDIKFFDLSFWRIILLDQRGAKRSIPFGEMKENTTQNLISDLEQLRNALKIDKWLLFGGSCGSTLALSYGESYPNHVLGFILRGIFLARLSDNKHFWQGIKNIFPEAWQELNDFLAVEKRCELISSYYQLLMNPSMEIALPAAKALLKYDFICSVLNIVPEQLNTLLADNTLVLGIARTFVHYSINNFFLSENQLITNIQTINHLPLIIVHGRYDIISLAKNAYELHQLWPNSSLFMVDAAGHSASEPEIAVTLTQATELMKQNFNTPDS